MVKFALTIFLWVVDTAIDQPKIVELGIDVNTSYYFNSFDNTVSIAAVLTPDQLNSKGVFIEIVVKPSGLAPWDIRRVNVGT